MVRGVIHIINPYDPGKFPSDISQKYGIDESEVISLASNENPFLPPENVRRIFESEYKHINRYPHPSYPELKKKISTYIGVDESCIALGNGASEILKMICEVNLEAFDPVVIPIPGYTLYAILAMMMDASLKFIEFPGYNVRAEDVLSEEAKLIFLCSPNNPTGNTVKRKEVIRILENTNAIVVIDEAYTEFSDKSFIDLTNEFENLIVVRSFSKFFSLAGMRVGYAVSKNETIEAIEKVRLPFCISNIAARVAEACIDSLNHFRKIRDEIVKERIWLEKSLRKFKNLEVYPSEANFILVKVKEEDLDTIEKKIESNGIIVRDVTGLMGLDGPHIRITVGKRPENEKLVGVLEEIFE
jgi:histidinol-phosphate aminotransferase